MRRVALTALVALPFALAAAAAPAAAQSAAPFTGPRVEGIIGWDRIQNNGHNDDVMYGVDGGYDVSVGNGVIAGIDGEFTDSNNKSCYGAETAGDPRICAKAARDLFIGGRVGKIVGGGRTLLYVKAGYTNARIKLTENDGQGQYTLAHDNLNGARIGVGAEYAVGPNSYVKAEYRYSNYEQGFSRNQALAGFGFRF